MATATRGFSALASGDGRIRAGGVERDLAFEEPDHAVDADVDASYHAKHDRYGRVSRRSKAAMWTSTSRATPVNICQSALVPRVASFPI